MEKSFTIFWGKTQIIQAQIYTLLTINGALGLDTAESSHFGKNPDFETLSGASGGSYYTRHRNKLSASTPRGFLNPGPTGTMATAPQRARRQQQHQSTHQQSLPALTTFSPLQQDKRWPGGSIDAEPSASQEKDGEHSAAIFFLSGCV